MTIWLLTCIGSLVVGLSMLIIMAFTRKAVFNRDFWLFIIATVLLFALVGLISAQSNEFPVSFWILQAIAFVLGILYVWLFYTLFNWASTSDFWTGFLVAFGLTGIGAAASSGVFGLVVGPVDFLWQYVVASLFFPTPYLFFQSYIFWMAIPARKFKRWFYPVNERLPILEQYKPITIYFKISPLPEQEPEIGCWVSAPSEKPVGQVFHFLLAEYNAKHVNSPIAIYTDASARKLAGWIFGIESGGELRVVEPERSFVGNRIGDETTIMARSFMD